MICSERRWVATALAAVLVFGGCGGGGDEPGVAVVRVREIALDGPLSQVEAEVSGMVWNGDKLLFLPQFPTNLGAEGEMAFFQIGRGDIEAWLDGDRSAALAPTAITCVAPWLPRFIEGYDGMEAVAVISDRCYMAVEARGDSMKSYLVIGRLKFHAHDEIIDLERFTGLPLQTNIPNVSIETLVADDKRVLAIGECNGANVNPDPVVQVFDFRGDLVGTLPMAPVEYRITDATALDGQRRFWVLNTFWREDRAQMQPGVDAEVTRFGAPSWLDDQACVERLLELRISEGDSIVRTDTPPLWLEPLGGGNCRNWEALVRLGDRGFLLMTDEHPGSMLAFVPLPPDHIVP